MQGTASRLTLLTHAAPPAGQALLFGGDGPADDKSLRRLRGHGIRQFGPDRVVRSPALAAAETALALGAAGAEADAALRDRAYGTWDGRTIAAVVEAERERFALWLRDPDAAAPDGESAQDLVARASAWLRDQESERRHVLAITHPPVVRACLVAAMACPPAAWFRLDVGFGTRTVLTHSGAGWRVSLVNGPL